MAKRTIILDQIDHRTFDLTNTRVIDLPPPTEQLDITPTDSVQEFTPSMSHYFDKVVVQKIPDNKYINISLPQNVYDGEVEVQDND